MAVLQGYVGWAWWEQWDNCRGWDPGKQAVGYKPLLGIANGVVLELCCFWWIESMWCLMEQIIV